MSYDLRIYVKPQGAPDDCYAEVAVPERDQPTYNLGQMFRACMDWNYDQSEYYRVVDVLPNIERGIHELHVNRKKYEKYSPPNGWGTLSGATECLESLRQCIYETAERIPIECLWMSW